jgi:hypothetical protein
LPTSTAHRHFPVHIVAGARYSRIVGRLRPSGG